MFKPALPHTEVCSTSALPNSLREFFVSTCSTPVCYAINTRKNSVMMLHKTNQKCDPHNKLAKENSDLH